MGLQYISCPRSTLFILGIFNIIGHMTKRKNILEDVFAFYFNDPLVKSNWDKIKTVIEPSVSKSLMPSGGTPSKPPRQLDGSFTPIKATKMDVNIAFMYNTAHGNGIIKSGMDDKLLYYFDGQVNSQQNVEAFQRWDAIITAYLVLKNIDDYMELLIQSIKPLYKTGNNVNKTPSQLWFYADEYMHGEFSSIDSLKLIAWNAIDIFKTSNLSDPGIIDVILNLPTEELWYIDIPTVVFGGSYVENFNVSGDDFVVLTSTGEPYEIDIVFTPDAGSPTFSYNTYETYNKRVIKYTITPDGGNISGSIKVTYKTLDLA